MVLAFEIDAIAAMTAGHPGRFELGQLTVEIYGETKETPARKVHPLINRLRQQAAAFRVASNILQALTL